ncbi:MAG: molybdate ABC transporter substrate-binding protein [Dokdonella sp.]
MLIGSIVLVAMLGGPAFAQNLLVFAAASTKPALDKVFASVDGIAPDDVKVSYAASSQLARQIEAGAPAAVFVSADEGWMNYLDARKLIVAGTRADLLGNALVLIASSASHVKLDLVPGVDLAATLGADGHLALAEPNSVPAGKYAKAALTKLGIWDRVRTRIVAADNVRAALNFVARGEAPLGIVYRSDALSEPSVRIVATFPADTHASIVYPAAIVAGHDSLAARRLLDALHSPAAQIIFREAGFDAPPR